MPLASAAAKVAYNERDLLKACGRLDKRQWSSLFSKGVDLTSLSDDQWAVFGRTIMLKNAAFLRDPEARLIFKGTRKQKGKHFDYEFTLTSSAGLEPTKWTLSTPEYKKEDKSVK